MTEQEKAEIADKIKVKLVEHTLVSMTHIRPELLTVDLREEMTGVLANTLWITLRMRLYGDHRSRLYNSVAVDMPKGRWQMFLWSIAPRRVRRWLRERYSIGATELRAGFDTFEVYPGYVPNTLGAQSLTIFKEYGEKLERA